MDQKLLAQLIQELIEAQGEALGLVVTALCQQVDPARLTADLRKTIAAAEQLSTSAIAVRMAKVAMAAAEAERMHQARPPSEGPHPKR